MSMAYFSHVPEAATQIGMPEETVPGTSERMMDRSLDGNAARNQALEGALAELSSIDVELLSRHDGSRVDGMVHAVSDRAEFRSDR
jgi:uncharacterized protein (DUF885 family)